jgi:hypothetical protein
MRSNKATQPVRIRRARNVGLRLKRFICRQNRHIVQTRKELDRTKQILRVFKTLEREVTVGE